MLSYHPWCAAAWFRHSSKCTASGCGRINPMWLKAYGFSILQKKDPNGATHDSMTLTGATGGLNMGSEVTAPVVSTLNCNRK